VETTIMAKKWIQGAIKHEGALTRKAKAAGMSVQQFIGQAALIAGTHFRNEPADLFATEGFP